jgi:outer membrane receptor protein involved in Fe transport
MQAFRTFVVGVAMVGIAGVSTFAQSGAATDAAQQQQQPPPPPPPPPPTPPVKPDDPTYKETVVVSASKTEQQLVNAPATISVIGGKALETAPSNNYGDLLRSVPGVNVTQISARDINITSRGSTSSLATSQLAVLDGRSLYQDFFGFVMWDFMPANLNEIEQIEVIRGPASAVWGANAVSGVINIITKTPRDMQGTSFTMGAGSFGRQFYGNGERNGGLVYGNITHAQAINDKWAYKLSVGSYQSDAFGRPSGVVPGGTAAYPAFQNSGTSQPKVDLRMDRDGENGSRISLSGGFAGTDGIMHTGIGPFDIREGTKFGYAKANYSKNAVRVQAFMNYLDGDALNLLAVDQSGAPVRFDFSTKTFDLEAGDTRMVAGRHVLTYGGNVRYNQFDLSIAPTENSRTEGGIYAQDEIFINDSVRFVAGARVDKFSSIDGVVFSPRAALLLKPAPTQTLRFSFNRAFRAPSMINNNLDTIVTNALPLGAINAGYGAAVYRVPTAAVGNQDLTEERQDAFEISYTGNFADRLTFSAAAYYTRGKDQIFFTQVSEWGASPAPPNFPGLGPFPGSAIWAQFYAAAPTIRFPKEFTYLNLGQENNRGIELGIDAILSNTTSMYANYSWQDEPDTEFALSETNLAPTNRFNAGVSYTAPRLFGSFGVNFTDDAFWQDVLDARYHGRTDSHLTANATIGTRWANGRYTASLKVVNLTDKQHQSHVFGDILRRQIVGEMRVNLK